MKIVLTIPSTLFNTLVSAWLGLAIGSLDEPVQCKDNTPCYNGYGTQNRKKTLFL